MALRVLSFPVLLFGLSVSQYLLSTGSHNQSMGQYFRKQDFVHLLLSLSAVAVISTIFIMFFASRLMSPILGLEWDQSAKLLYWLAPISMVSLIWNSVSTLFYLKNLWELFFRVSIARLLIILLVTLVCALFEISFDHTIFALIFFNSLILVVGIFVLWKSLSND